MTKMFTLFSVMLSYCISAQVSYEFKKALPPASELVNSVSSAHYGNYKNKETGTIFQFGSDGVSMITIIYSYITKEQVRETSRYQVRNGYLFGVVEGDSLPCIFEEDKYFFGIKQKVKINGADQQAVLKKVSENSYILNFREGSGYSPSLLSFKGNQLLIRHFDYPGDTRIFDNISDRQEIQGSDYITQVLNPTQQEWEKLDQQQIFDQEYLFTRE